MAEEDVLLVAVRMDADGAISDTQILDYSLRTQLGAPNLNMTFDSVRSRFGISNMSWPRYLNNQGQTGTANPSAGLTAITSNYGGWPNGTFAQNPVVATKPYTYYAQSGIGISTLSVLDFNGNPVRINQFDPEDINAKYKNSLLDRLGFTFRQLCNYNGVSTAWFVQGNYESKKAIVNANAFPYPLTNNLRFDTAVNIGLSVNNSGLPMFNLSTQREFENINIEAQSDTCFALDLPTKLITPFYLIKSDIFEGNVSFNSENDGATESIMLCCNKAYISGDYAYSFGTAYAFKATKSFVISGIKTAILKPDLTPAEVEGGTAVIYKVVKPVKFFEELAEEQQNLSKGKKSSTQKSK